MVFSGLISTAKLTLQFRGSVLTSDAGLLAHRELDDALGLTTMAGGMLAEARTGRNGRHALVGLFRQSVFGRLALRPLHNARHANLQDRRDRSNALARANTCNARSRKSNE